MSVRGTGYKVQNAPSTKGSAVVCTMLLALGGCSGEREVAMGAPTWEDLSHATYEGLQVAESVRLVHGIWHGEPYEEGGASRPRVSLVSGFLHAGDMDGDGAEESVGLLSESGGGTGEYVYFVVVARGSDGFYNLATTLLGDRVQVRAARIESGGLIADVVRASSNDAACCPGQLATLNWTMGSEGRLDLTESRDAGRLSLDVVSGTEWVLGSWDRHEPAPEEPLITLTYDDGRLVGSAGCNNYFATAEDGDSPGEVTIGPPGSTMMFCSEEAMVAEGRFLAQFGEVTRYGFLAARLALSYEVGGQSGVMLFDRR